MINTKNVANAVGGKTARACDSCIKKRARWYCAADDAFLCQVCDASVHSANPLARRHARVRLKSSSSTNNKPPPSWHQGFTKKARTPRSANKKATQLIPTLVPEIGTDENEEHYEEEQLLYTVPILDCDIKLSDVDDNKIDAKRECCYNEQANNNSLHGFLPSDIELAEFAADVETLLGSGLDSESFGMEELGFLDNYEVKVEKKEEICLVGDECVRECENVNVEPFEFSFDYDSTYGEEDENVIVKECYSSGGGGDDGGGGGLTTKKNKVLALSLDYEGVVASWTGQRSPWTTGERPEFDPYDQSWPACMGFRETEVFPGGQTSGPVVPHPHPHPHTGLGDGGREARVSRYREKRRTRLFSKKIRYEVRKLNAEKRPRMKGRFVKRPPGSAFPSISTK